jgi:3-oxoacyl-[acyl-carrier protein] reductase
MTGRRFEERVAIVTGGSSGIGRATCAALAAEGARVVVVGRTPAHVEETLAAIDSRAGADPAARIGLTLDVRSESGMEEMARRTLDAFGRIDILVTSAASSPGTASTLGRRTLLCRLPASAWDEIVDTNLRGVFLANRAVLPAMIRQRGGEIVNLSSSIIASGHWAFASAYCASKFAVMGLSEALAEEVRGFGIRVQVMVPDVVETPMLEKAHLAVFHALPAERAAGLILEMLAGPEDRLLVNPMIEPFGTWTKAWRGRGAAI